MTHRDILQDVVGPANFCEERWMEKKITRNAHWLEVDISTVTNDEENILRMKNSELTRQIIIFFRSYSWWSQIHDFKFIEKEVKLLSEDQSTPIAEKE